MVGEEALLATGAGVVSIASVKRCLGCAGDRCAAAGRRPPDWCAGCGLIAVPGGQRRRPDEIASLIIAEAVNRAKQAAWESLGLGVLRDELAVVPANFGCSATFSLQQRQLLRGVGSEIGFEALDLRNIVEEPIAAGISYAKLAGIQNGKVLIYDFGGGTFDTAILDVDVDAGRLTILAADGEPWLGGDDIDQLIYVAFLDAIAQERETSPNLVEDSLGATDRHALRLLCTRAKEHLSRAETFKDALLSEKMGTLLLDLTRERLEQLVLGNNVQQKNLIERSLDCVLSTYRTARTFELAKKGRLLDAEGIHSTALSDMAGDIRAVILVGGVTKMPLVRNRIVDLFGESPVVEERVVEPITAVAVGAAYPRELDQFNLLHPPYSIQVVLSDQPGGEDEIVTLHQAYDRLEYFPHWQTNTLPVYSSAAHKPKRKYGHARLRFVGDGIQVDDVPLSVTASGTRPLYLTMDLAGRLEVNGMVSRNRHASRVPLTHPLQEDIIQAEDEAEQRAREADWEKELTERRWTMATEE